VALQRAHQKIVKENISIFVKQKNIMAYRVSQPLAATQFPGDDKKKKNTNKKSTVKYTEKDLTPSQKKKIDSINLSESARAKAINAFAKINKKGK